MNIDDPFDLLGLFQGGGLPFRGESAPLHMPNMIWLHRRPILPRDGVHGPSVGRQRGSDGLISVEGTRRREPHRHLSHRTPHHVRLQ